MKIYMLSGLVKKVQSNDKLARQICLLQNFFLSRSNIEHLKDVIKRKVGLINEDKDLLKRICSSETKQVKEYINADSEHFEKSP